MKNINSEKQKINLNYLLAIHQAVKITLPRFLALKKFFENDFEKAFKSPIHIWAQSGIDRKAIEKFFLKKDLVPVGNFEKIFQQKKIKVLLYGDENFPESLKYIDNPPAILFIRGEIIPTDFPSIAVIGTRKISNYGKQVLEYLLPPLIEKGLTIVSGLALGTDNLAHKITLKNKGRTLAVLGNAIDKIQPAFNEKTGEDILEKNLGAIVSEYLPGSPTRAGNFPVRNRIVSGLSQAVLIIEASERSGTLITARLANEQGREVFAVPGDIFSGTSKGTNQLIFDGKAHPAISAGQILEIMGFKDLEFQKKMRTEIPSSGETDILNLFSGSDKIHIDELIRNSSYSTTEISSKMMILELQGLVKNLGQQVYQKVV